MGCVYILTNPAFKEGWVKIGMSSRDVGIRAKELDNTSTPLPFEVYAILKTQYFKKAEHHIHQMLDLVTDTRIRKSREFFNISPEKALEILNSVKELLPDAVILRGSTTEKENPVVTPSISMPSVNKDAWIIPANKAFFDLEGCFKDLGGVYWKQKNNFNVGDIIFVYSAKPDKCVKYKCHVDKCELAYDKEMEIQGKYDLGNGYLTNDCKYAYIKCDKVYNSEKLDFSQLKAHGLKGSMIRGVKCSEELINYINSIEK